MSDQALDGLPVLIPVLPNHRFDEAALDRYLAAHMAGYRGPCEVRQFQGGQSNPTFHLRTPDAEYVLRKKPPGKLLPSAHAVDREYRVQHALAGTDVPVARMCLLCEDDAVIGTAFYVMQHVQGRVFIDRALPGCSPGARRAIYDDMARVMARLHAVDWRAVGLEGFGRPDGYIARQIDRWSKQYVGARPDHVPAMEKLMGWLPAHVPAHERDAIAHGDFRLGNLIYHPTEPRVLAVLDWELSTIGHPLADLAYSCLSWRLPPEAGGLQGVDAPGLPSEAEYVSAYCREARLADLPDLDFFVVFALFRLASIAAGVYRRALDGNAADPSALQRGVTFRIIAERAWEIAQQIR